MINQVLKIATGLFFVVFAASESAAQAPADWKIFEYEAGLLRNHLVREELQISEPQARKIKKEYNKFFEKLNLIKRIHLPRAVEGSTEFDALIEEGNELIAGARSKLDETALGFQQKRLTQLANQFDRWKETGIEIKGLKKDLGITKSQEEKISKANDDFAKELKELKASYEAKFERLLKKNIKDLSDPLDVEQKNQFDKLFGQPFSLIHLRLLRF